jgi:hypothetical protein
MSKQKTSKLDPFAERLIAWFTPVDKGGDGFTLRQAQDELRKDGCSVSLQRLSEWWERQQAEMAEAALLQQIATGAELHRKVKTQFATDAPPELQTLIDLHRVLIMQLSAQAATNPKMLELADRSMRTVMDYFSGQTKAKLEDRKLNLSERRVVLMEKQLKEVKVVAESTLSAEQQRQRLKEILK